MTRKTGPTKKDALGLDATDHEIMHMLIAGSYLTEIKEALGFSTSGWQDRLSSLRRKMRARTNYQAIANYVELISDRVEG